MWKNVLNSINFILELCYINLRCHFYRETAITNYEFLERKARINFTFLLKQIGYNSSVVNRDVTLQMEEYFKLRR